MTHADRLMLSTVFKFIIRLLAAILYAVTNRKDSGLMADYERLTTQLEEWQVPNRFE